jgi:hypothetical protein
VPLHSCSLSVLRLRAATVTNSYIRQQKFAEFWAALEVEALLKVCEEHVQVLRATSLAAMTAASSMGFKISPISSRALLKECVKEDCQTPQGLELEAKNVHHYIKELK